MSSCTIIKARENILVTSHDEERHLNIKSIHKMVDFLLKKEEAKK
jgi:hypothetical protein